MKQLLRTVAITFLLFCCNYLTCWPAYSQSFQKEKLEFAPLPDLSAQFEWIDADGDKDLDVLVFKLNANENKKTNIRLYENTNGQFQEIQNPFGNPADLVPVSYAFGDYDQDGDLDFLFQDSQKPRLAQNNGNLSFTLQDLAGFAPGYLLAGLQWQDVDGDTDLDLIYPNPSPSFSLGVYINDQHTFRPSPHPLPLILRSFAFADVNNDGLPDFAAAKGQTTSNPVFLHINKGDGAFEIAEEALAPGMANGGKMLWADMDGDQDLDLFLTESDQKCTLFRNQFTETGTPRFERAYQFKDCYFPLVAIGDIDQDGLPDLVLSGRLSAQETTLLYLNQSSNTTFAFEEKDLKLSKAGADLDLVDLNRDGSLDLFFMIREAGTQAAVFDLYKSPVVNPDFKLSPPANLQTAIQEEVVLSWDPVAAAGTVHYSLELKVNGLLYYAPLALADGSPLWPQQPARNILPRQALRHLPAGTYTWRVQARDEAGRYSGFSDSRTFTIAPAPADLVLQQPELTRVRLQWTDPTLGGGSFGVFRRAANKPLENIAVLPAGTTFYEDQGLMTNQQYEYLVKAQQQGAWSAASEVVKVDTRQFAVKTYTQPPAGIYGLGQSADLDNDGDYDLALLGRGPDLSLQAALLKNDGTGTFTRSELLSAAESTTHNFIIRDMDNDGDEDICAGIGYYVFVFENTNGLFRKAYTSRSFSVQGQLAVEDFNHDGRQDLFLSHSTTNNTDDDDYKLLLQDQDFSFVAAPYRFIPENSRLIGRFAIGDLNNDGFADIVMGGSNYNQYNVWIFYNLGGQSFAPQQATIPGLSSYAGLGNFWLVDYNQDGRLDIMKPNAGHFPLQVFEANGDLTFQAGRGIEILNSSLNNVTDIQTADFDLNGYPDLLVSADNAFSILQYQGQGKYEPTTFPLPAIRNGKAYITDFENDGDLDLHHEGYNFFYENKLLAAASFSNEAPATPTRLTVTPGCKTRVSWSPAPDDRSPAGALTYNLLLQDRAGKVWLHPETNAAGTFRRRLAPGNAGNKTFFDLNDLPAGQYSVQVQALDAAFQLSAFSPPLSFEIQAGPANLSLKRETLHTIQLTWQETLSAETEVVVERRTTESDFEIIARLPPNSTAYTDARLKYNQAYTYRVYALVQGQPTAPTNIVEWNTALFVLNQDPGMPSLINTWVEAGDYNNDGRMDLSIYGNPLQNGFWRPQETKVLENTAAGWLAHPVSPGSVALTSQLQFFDFNGDHQLDLFRFGSTDLQDKSELHVNQGKGVFQTAPSLLTSQPQILEGWWDLDADNDLDAVMFEWGSTLPWHKRILQNDGGGNFSTKEVIKTNCTGCSHTFFAGDFDRDGDEDLLQHDYTSEGGSGYYYMQNNQGKLSRTNIVITTESGFQIKVVDYNNDGWPDIFLLGDTFINFGGKSKLFKNQGLDATGLPRFVKVQDQLPASNWRLHSDWVDFDHDGDLDFFIGTNPLTIYLNEGQDVFSEYKPASLGRFQNSGDLFDFDQDGDMDIYLRWSNENPQGAVLVNQLVTGANSDLNQAPQPPGNLSAVQDEKGLHLTWDPATDDLTPAPGLTYDVILYREGKAITKASLDPVSGNRQKLAFGRSPSRLTLRNLAVGAYTWKVQAVDASYRGSALSAAGDFFFKPEPPLVSDTLIYRCGREVSLQARGENIEWFRDAALSVKLASGAFRPQVTQEVYVTQTIGGVRGIARKVAITIFEQPGKPALSAFNRYTYCRQNSGMPLFLQATGENIKWYSDKDLKNQVATGTGFSAPAEARTYYVTQTMQDCESPAAEVILQPVQIDTRISQSRDTLYASEKNGLSYQWYLDNRILSWETSRYIKIKQDGRYTVRIYKDGCWENSQELVLSEPEPLAREGIRVYPNPSPGDVFVQVPAGALALEVKVFDALGRLVYQTSLDRSPGTPLPVPTKKWMKGLYFFHITTHREQVISKVVIR